MGFLAQLYSDGRGAGRAHGSSAAYLSPRFADAPFAADSSSAVVPAPGDVAPPAAGTLSPEAGSPGLPAPAAGPADTPIPVPPIDFAAREEKPGDRRPSVRLPDAVSAPSRPPASGLGVPEAGIPPVPADPGPAPFPMKAGARTLKPRADEGNPEATPAAHPDAPGGAERPSAASGAVADERSAAPTPAPAGSVRPARPSPARQDAAQATAAAADASMAAPAGGDPLSAALRALSGAPARAARSRPSSHGKEVPAPTVPEGAVPRGTPAPRVPGKRERQAPAPEGPRVVIGSLEIRVEAPSPAASAAREPAGSGRSRRYLVEW